LRCPHAVWYQASQQSQQLQIPQKFQQNKAQKDPQGKNTQIYPPIKVKTPERLMLTSSLRESQDASTQSNCKLMHRFVENIMSAAWLGTMDGTEVQSATSTNEYLELGTE
jgi:hypothetical protein